MKKMNILTIALSATFLLGACSSDSSDEELIESEPKTEVEMENESDNENEETEESNEIENQADQKGLTNVSLEVTLDDAVNLFYDQFESQEINIESIELKEKNGRYIYELEGWDGQYEYELEFDAETSEILEEEKEKSNDKEGILDVESAVSPLVAMNAALELSDESAYVKEWELELEGDQMIYDIDIENGRDQKIDALTGEVL